MVKHIVTLIGPGGEEVCFEIKTDTDSYSVVVNEINAQRNARKLWNYSIFEALPCDAPF